MKKFLRKLYKNKYIKLYSLEQCKLYGNLHCKIKNECPHLHTHPLNIIFIPRDNQITTRQLYSVLLARLLKMLLAARWLLLYGCLCEFADTKRFSVCAAQL